MSGKNEDFFRLRDKALREQERFNDPLQIAMRGALFGNRPQQERPPEPRGFRQKKIEP